MVAVGGRGTLIGQLGFVLVAAGKTFLNDKFASMTRPSPEPSRGDGGAGADSGRGE
ncbi:MAG: hypothetical protein U0793_29005 [Gemmataceae bacterium]